MSTLHLCGITITGIAEVNAHSRVPLVLKAVAWARSITGDVFSFGHQASEQLRSGTIVDPG
jgi:hypothetical protein